MRKKSIEQVKSYFAENNCELLESVYINAKTKMRYKCLCGRTSYINLNNFKNGKKCGCDKNVGKRLKVEDIKKIVEEKGYKFINCDFVKSKHLVEYVCKCGNYKKNQIQTIRKSNGCSNCLRSKFSFDYDYVKSFFAEKGCELLSTTYINARTKLKYRCNCGNESEIVFDSFRKGNRCKKCGAKKSNVNRILNQSFVESYFSKFGCKLLDEYKSANIPMKYECVCGCISKISYANFRLGKRCKNCFIERISGNNNYQWYQDREEHNNYLMFKEKCYKMLRITLKKFNNKKTCKTEKMLGYSFKDLQEKIQTHPNWDFLKDKKWSLDHIFPLKAFWDYGVSDPAIINDLDNLQPLLHTDNMKKGSNYDALLFEEWLNRKGVKYHGTSKQGRRAT
jgi:hypothetical protein